VQCTCESKKVADEQHGGAVAPTRPHRSDSHTNHFYLRNILRIPKDTNHEDLCDNVLASHGHT
jgi:hypothetical protein